MMVNLNKLATELHSAAVEKGFWGVEDAEIKHIAKMHSELSEAIQEDRCGRPMLYVDDIEVEARITDPAMFDGRKPEGVAVELADFVMMALDLCAKEEYALPSGDPHGWLLYDECNDDALRDSGLWTLVCALHMELCNIVYNLNVAPKAICMVHEWLRVHGVDLLGIIRLKMEYNKSRPALHGRAY